MSKMRPEDYSDDMIRVRKKTNDSSANRQVLLQRRARETKQTEQSRARARQLMTRKENEAARAQEKKERKNHPIRTFFVRVMALVLVVLFLAIYGASALALAIVHGSSPTLRSQLVMMALQASATKWIPPLFVSEEELNEIVSNSRVISQEEISISDVKPRPTRPEQGEEQQEEDWGKAVRGILYQTVQLPGCKAYIVLVKDPSRVFVGVASDDFDTAEEGLRIWDAAKKYPVTIVMNAGEFRDPGGVGTGSQPMGLTFSEGRCVWNDGITTHTFIGFDQQNRLVVREGMSVSKANELGIRDGVMFQTDNILITNDGTKVTTYRKSGDASTSQRTAIGQRQDGTVIMVVTDGRTAASIGATYEDILDLMLSLGAVTAAMLDGGSSSLLFYKDYPSVLGIDESTLDTYQKKGILNKYKAFSNPRRLPTFFMVLEGGES